MNIILNLSIISKKVKSSSLVPTLLNYVFYLFLMISGSKVIKKGNGYILRKCYSKKVSRAIGWVEYSDPDLPSQLFSNPLLKIRLSSHGLHCFSSSVMDDPSNMSPKQWPINSEHALSRSTNHSADMDELKPGEINRLNIGSCVRFFFVHMTFQCARTCRWTHFPWISCISGYIILML